MPGAQLGILTVPPREGAGQLRYLAFRTGNPTSYPCQALYRTFFPTTNNNNKIGTSNKW